MTAILLYRSLDDEVKARVAYALSPEAVVRRLCRQAYCGKHGHPGDRELPARSIAGRDPQGLNDLLTEAAASIQALTEKQDVPIDWAKLADLETYDTATSATIILLPKPGKESEARNLALHMLDEFRHSTDTDATFTGAPRSAPVKNRHLPFDGLAL